MGAFPSAMGEVAGVAGVEGWVPCRKASDPNLSAPSAVSAPSPTIAVLVVTEQIADTAWVHLLCFMTSREK